MIPISMVKSLTIQVTLMKVIYSHVEIICKQGVTGIQYFTYLMPITEQQVIKNVIL